jgi:hypothetical protein
MAAGFSRARTSRRAYSTSGVRRGVAVAALTGGIAGFATLGIAAVTNPVQAAPGNNGAVKVSGDDLSSQPNNEPHVPCNFNIQWYGFDTGTRHATVTFSAQAPTSGASYAVSGDTTPTFSGGPGLDATVAYTLTPSGADPQPQQGYHVKITVTTDKTHGASDKKSKVYWIGPCSVPTTPTEVTTPPTTPTEVTTPPTTPTEVTTPPTTPTEVTTPPTTDTTSAPTQSGSITVPPTESGSIATSTASTTPQPGQLSSTSTSPQPGAVVPTRIESGLATLPTSSSTQQHSSDRWPLLAVSALSAALGAAGLFPRRRGAKRS